MNGILDQHPAAGQMLTGIEQACRTAILEAVPDPANPLQAMLLYHMGWFPEPAPRKGKRIRPLLLCLCTAACGGDWQNALPAAAAVELIHNFSLIHDDIEDRSATRHGRPTLWQRDGIAQAINAGDALYSIALAQVWSLAENFSPAAAAECSQLLVRTCIRLTEGQSLDLDFETRESVQEAEYLKMITGKTSALLSCALETGAILSNADAAVREHARLYGHNLGLAFQLVDDHLGLWGEEAVTGKSSSSDLLEHKLTYPVILGLTHSTPFARRWSQGGILPQEIPSILIWLRDVGADQRTLETAQEYTEAAFDHLTAIHGQDPERSLLRELTRGLLERAA